MSPPTSSTCCGTREQGREYLGRAKGIDAATLAALAHFGLLVDVQRAGRDQDRRSCSTSAPTRRIDHRRHRRRGDVLERARQDDRQRYRGEYSHTDAAEAFGQHLGHVSTEHMIEHDAKPTGGAIFNLGYYTWVEQQGTPFELFEQRRSPGLLASGCAATSACGTR